MNKAKLPVSKLSLEDVQDLFDKWRKNKRWHDSIPEELWQAAVDLVKDFPIGQVSKILRLDQSKLKARILAIQRVKDSNTVVPSFVELDFSNLPSSAECIVEAEERNGSKMKISIKGQPVDVIGFAKAFWSRDL